MLPASCSVITRFLMADCFIFSTSIPAPSSSTVIITLLSWGNAVIRSVPFSGLPSFLRISGASIPWSIAFRVANQAAQVTNVTKEQAKGVEDIIKGVENSREQVRQVSTAVKEQAKQGQNIIIAVQNVTKQASEVTQATKEQTQGIEEIIRGIANAREQVRQIAEAVKEQAKQGKILLLQWRM